MPRKKYKGPKHEGPKLPDNEKESLLIIADHIEKIISSNKVLDDGVLVNFTLIWELHGYACEARRVAGQPSI